MKEIKCAFRIPKAELLAMRELQSVDETRYVICAVHFEVTKKRVMLVATNGRLIGTLLASVWEDDLKAITGKTEFTCDYPLVKYLPQNKSKDGYVMLTYDGTRVEFTSLGQTVTCAAIEGKFPKWRQVVPKGKIIPAHYNFDPKFLNQFYRAAKWLHPKSPALKLRAHEHDNGNYDRDYPPYSVFFSDDRFYGALMPIRSDMEPCVPGWMTEPDEESAPAPAPEPVKVEAAA